MIWGSVAGYLTSRTTEWLLPGIEANLFEGDTIILTQADRIAVGYNSILDRAGGEPVVLMHDDVELKPGARIHILEALENADVVGVVGGSGLTELAWWKAAEKRGRVQHGNGRVDFGPPGEVDAVDGLLLAFTAEAAAQLRFDEDYPGFHGYDMDICFQARAAGLKVTAADIPLVHHTKGGFGDRAAWDACDEIWREKWLA